jgi:tetratricopeptide (TPR) repeat protein
VLAGLELPRLQAYHLAVADTLERVYGKSAAEKAAEIAYHLYQAGSAADPVRTSGHLAQAARNAMAVGAFEEVLRLVERNLQLLPADKIRERAEALAIRGQAYFGLARNNDAKAAWSGALGRYEELGDAKASAGIHARLHEIGADGVTAGRPRAHERRHDEAEAPEPAEPEPAER